MNRIILVFIFLAVSVCCFSQGAAIYNNAQSDPTYQNLQRGLNDMDRYNRQLQNQSDAEPTRDLEIEHIKLGATKQEIMSKRTNAVTEGVLKDGSDYLVYETPQYSTTWGWYTLREYFYFNKSNSCFFMVLETKAIMVSKWTDEFDKRLEKVSYNQYRDYKNDTKITIEINDKTVQMSYSYL